NRVPTRSLDHMAPPVDHFPVRGGAQLLVPMLDDAVLQPGLSRRQAEEDIVAYTELGGDPAEAGFGRTPVAPALWHRSADSCRKLVESGAEERVATLRDGRGVQRATVAGEPREPLAVDHG